MSARSGTGLLYQSDGNTQVPSLAATKGDTLVANAIGDLVREQVGADGTVQVADSTVATGVKWAALASASWVGAAAATVVASAQVSGDSVARHTVKADGKMEWGPGNGAVDTNLYRGASGVLNTDLKFNAGSDICARSGAPAQVFLGAGGPASQAGIIIGSDLDTNLYRSAADTLKTDDALVIVGNVGFYGQTATAKPTGVAVTAAGIHAALVTLNLIAA